ncbi:MAG: glycosyltransferase [Muribaculaceae bacterium]|nr:glycosyltransferase [Muribaculaceae bacterium]
MDTPLFSIITITFNAASTLPPTLESVGSQTYQNFEHIIVDGASADDTIAVARRLGRSDLRIVSEPDKGLYDAMNKGLRLARGKYVIFLNAGDAFASPVTLSQYADASDNYDPDIIYGDTLIVNEDRQIVRERHLRVPERLTVDSFSNGMLICHQAFCVKRDLAPEYDMGYRFSADYDWTIKCISRTEPAKCVNLHCVVIHYLDDGMTEKNKKASLLERFDIMKKHYGLCIALSRHFSFVPRAIARKLNLH